MNTSNRQGRSKQRLQETVQASPYPKREMPASGQQSGYSSQQFQSVPQNRSMDNVMYFDNSVLLPVEIPQSAIPQQSQAQYLNLDRSFVRPTSSRTNVSNSRSNVQILQNIAIRPSANSSRTNMQEVMRSRSQHHLVATPSNSSLNMQQKIVHRMPENMRLPPGGKFVAFDMTSGQEMQVPTLPRSVSHLSVMSESGRNSMGSGVILRPAPSKIGNSMKKIDYPPYTFKMLGFTNAHKNGLLFMGQFFQTLFNPIVTAPSYILTASVNYAKLLCFEIEAGILGDFLCRLVSRTLETCSFPFVLEVKDAPHNWIQEMPKACVVLKSNFELEAKKIAVNLKTREPIGNENSLLPEGLLLEIIARRNCITIKFNFSKTVPSVFFSDIYKRIPIIAKYKETCKNDAKGNLSVSTQTENTNSIPKILMALHQLQLDMLNKSHLKSNYRDLVEKDHIQFMEEQKTLHNSLVEKMIQYAETMVVEDMRNRMAIPCTVKPTVTVSTQTEPVALIKGYEGFTYPKYMTSPFFMLTKKLILYIFSFYSRLHLATQRELERKRHYDRRRRDSMNVSRDGRKDDVDAKKSSSSLDSNKAQIYDEFIGEYKNILLQCTKISRVLSVVKNTVEFGSERVMLRDLMGISPAEILSNHVVNPLTQPTIVDQMISPTFIGFNSENNEVPFFELIQF